MNEKCDKFKALFLFSDDSSLEKHTVQCIECREQKDEFEKISNLIKEAKPLYFAQKKRAFHIKTACAVFLLVLSGTVFSTFYLNNSSSSDMLGYNQILSAEDYGFPVDSYGFIMVDE